MFAEDMKVYDFRLPFVLDNVRMVGWLDRSHDYTKREIPDVVIEKLYRLIAQRSKHFDLHVNTVRGIHPCNLCGEEIKVTDNNGGLSYLGMSEIWIPFKSLWFATPSLIVHYMEQHQYAPPYEFIEAVDMFDMSTKVIAQEAYDAAVRQMVEGT